MANVKKVRQTDFVFLGGTWGPGGYGDGEYTRVICVLQLNNGFSSFFCFPMWCIIRLLVRDGSSYFSCCVFVVVFESCICVSICGRVSFFLSVVTCGTFLLYTPSARFTCWLAAGGLWRTWCVIQCLLHSCQAGMLIRNRLYPPTLLLNARANGSMPYPKAADSIACSRQMSPKT